MRPELLQKYDAWYNEAEKAVQDNKTVLERVRRARLSVDYAILEAARLNDPNSFCLSTQNDNGEIQESKEIQNRLARFVETCHNSGITNMNEMRFTLDEYIANYVTKTPSHYISQIERSSDIPPKI